MAVPKKKKYRAYSGVYRYQPSIIQNVSLKLNSIKQNKKSLKKWLRFKLNIYQGSAKHITKSFFFVKHWWLNLLTPLKLNDQKRDFVTSLKELPNLDNSKESTLLISTPLLKKKTIKEFNSLKFTEQNNGYSLNISWLDLAFDWPLDEQIFLEDLAYYPDLTLLEFSHLQFNSFLWNDFIDELNYLVFLFSYKSSYNKSFQFENSNYNKLKTPKTVFSKVNFNKNKNCLPKYYNSLSKIASKKNKFKQNLLNLKPIFFFKNIQIVNWGNFKNIKQPKENLSLELSYLSFFLQAITLSPKFDFWDALLPNNRLKLKIYKIQSLLLSFQSKKKKKKRLRQNPILGNFYKETANSNLFEKFNLSAKKTFNAYNPLIVWWGFLNYFIQHIQTIKFNLKVYSFYQYYTNNYAKNILFINFKILKFTKNPDKLLTLKNHANIDFLEITVNAFKVEFWSLKKYNTKESPSTLNFFFGALEQKQQIISQNNLDFQFYNTLKSFPIDNVENMILFSLLIKWAEKFWAFNFNPVILDDTESYKFKKFAESKLFNYEETESDSESDDELFYWEIPDNIYEFKVRKDIIFLKKEFRPEEPIEITAPAEQTFEVNNEVLLKPEPPVVEIVETNSAKDVDKSLETTEEEETIEDGFDNNLQHTKWDWVESFNFDFIAYHICDLWFLNLNFFKNTSSSYWNTNHNKVYFGLFALLKSNSILDTNFFSDVSKANIKFLNSPIRSFQLASNLARVTRIKPSSWFFKNDISFWFLVSTKKLNTKLRFSKLKATNYKQLTRVRQFL